MFRGELEGIVYGAHVRYVPCHPCYRRSDRGGVYNCLFPSFFFCVRCSYKVWFEAEALEIQLLYLLRVTQQQRGTIPSKTVLWEMLGTTLELAQMHNNRQIQEFWHNY